MKHTQSTLMKSVLALLLCVSMLIGTTFAWFTDSVSTDKNIISSGNLDLEMYWSTASTGPWHNVDEAGYNTVFDYDNWEPGYTEVRYVKLVNNGSLALNYDLTITPESPIGKLAEVIQVYFDREGDPVNGREDLQNMGTLGSLKSVLGGGAVMSGTILAADQQHPTHPIGETVFTLAMSMITTAGNAYQNETAGTFGITAVATQAPYEEDSFGADYDSAAEMPVVLRKGSATALVPVQNNTVTAPVTLAGEGIAAHVPAGVAMEAGAERLTLTVTPLDSTDSGLVAVNEEVLIPVDIHVEGVADNNSAPIVIDLGAILPPNMNVGNYTFFHVEDGVNQPMTLVADASALTAHNTFTYDPLTGEVSVAMATFSEVVALADTSNVWNGETADSFAGGSGTEADPYVIANADQLVYLGNRVSNDNANYGYKHYKLVADLNFGGADNTNNGKIFYPIGYNKVGGEIATVADDWDAIYFEPINPAAPGDKDGDVAMTAADNSWYTYGGSFKGVFDGRGHTVSGIYQNTWVMRGDYNGHYYNDAMGLFGYVNGGTVKNLTIDNFKSEGEFAPTGCVTAYAGGSATFENIAVTNSHPATYNTGVACIVGWDNGNSTDFTFKNITVDDSNTSSALWGSWDVAASGILGSLKNNSYAHFENCNVAATIDVYNDVCGNYQYYWYRYSGAYIGTVYRRQDNGNGALDLAYGVTAENCTANFGDPVTNPRHEYYYCEFVENTQASYTHDYQMSRVPLDEIDMSGNKPVCDGHNHEEHGYETVNGQEVLVEDKQAVYLPYRQLFGGYGWGVDGVDIDEYVDKNGKRIIDISDITTAKDKFVVADGAENKEIESESTISVGELFAQNAELAAEYKIFGGNVQVTVSPVGDKSTAGATYVANADDWTQGTLTFSGAGAAQIIISDYYFCKPTSVFVTITEPQDVAKFEPKFTGNFLYRVGNEGNVPLGKLFSAKGEGRPIVPESVEVTVTTVTGNASGVYTKSAEWANGYVKFSGTGTVKVSITDGYYCTSTIVTLQVVDAVNATGAANATANNVVLHNDAGFGSLEVSGGYTLYGNGFTLTCDSDSVAADLGYSFVTLNSGTLDNVQIVCPNFDYAALYKTNLTSSDNRSYTENGKTRYYNARSAVMVSGNSQILNSRIAGGRAALNVSGGNVVVDNSRIELGAVANVLVGAANSLTLRDVTLVQKPTESTCDSETKKTLMGFSVLSICDANGDAAPITIEGNLVQHAWIDENDKQYVPSAGESIISTVLAKTEYLHDMDGDGKNESLNLGFAYMPESLTSKVNATTITDNRTNKDAVPYDYAEVAIFNGKTYVYSYKNTNGTADTFKTETAYVPNKYGDIITVNYADTADGLTTGKSFGTDGWVYELGVDLDKLSGYALDFSKLSMTVNGVPVTDYTVNGSTKPNTPVAVNAGGTTYTLTATIGDKTYTATYKVTGTETSKESPSLVAANYEAGICVASSYGGTWHGAAPALEGIQIKYWSVAEKQYKTINLADYTPTTKGQLNGTNTTWTYSPANGDFTLTLTGGQVHSGNSVNAMPVVCDGKLYFVAASSKGLVNSGNSARTIPVSYTFKDNNGGTPLTFSHTWSVAENKDAQYKYSDFCNGTLKKLEKSCVTGDTLVNLADGSMKRIDEVTYEDTLLVWNFFEGKYDTAPAAIIFYHGDELYEVLTLHFEDGTSVKTIDVHGFFDTDENDFVFIERDNVEDYIGHEFVKVKDDGYESVTLIDYSVTKEYTGCYSIQSAVHINFMVEGMFSQTIPPFEGWFDYFAIGDGMRYDEEAMRADIERYGLYSYDEFADYVTYEQFMAFNGPYLKVLVERGIVTRQGILDLIASYVN